MRDTLRAFVAPDIPALQFAIKTLLGGALALWCAFRFDLQQPQWALMTAFIVAQPLSGMVVQKGLARLFGKPERASKTYDEIVAAYQARLGEGIRAEDFDRVTPAFYRFPEGVADEQAYLVETWDESNQRLFDALRFWDEADLDGYQILHPAMGPVTVRERMLPPG